MAGLDLTKDEVACVHLVHDEILETKRCRLEENQSTTKTMQKEKLATS